MNNAIFVFDYPENEPVKSYSPGTPERKVLQKELDRLSSEVMDIPLIIGGKEVRTGNTEPVVMPHDHKHVLANYHKAGPEEVKMAIDAALKAHREWESFSYAERVSVTLRVAELIAKK
ncbi:MAG TPA: aldehyde dehydrogenase family protein, partial [Lentimicrobium sp.]|nr:aldehyde dehydrogenase family protein [Lentimicrobium sp.]